MLLRLFPVTFPLQVRIFVFLKPEPILIYVYFTHYLARYLKAKYTSYLCFIAFCVLVYIYVCVFVCLFIYLSLFMFLILQAKQIL